MSSHYTANPPHASQFTAPSFPFIQERSLQLSKGFRWDYSDRRSLQEMVPNIFIGPMAMAREREILDRHGITTLVAVRTPLTKHIFKTRFPEKYRYETIDLVEGSLLSTLPRVKPFVDACLLRGERLLFYDETGNAKAAVIVCSYLMEAGPMDSQSAYTLVKSKRLSIALSDHERYQLEEFETLLKARNSIIAHPYSKEELNRGNRRRKFEDDESVSGMTDETPFEDHHDHRRTTPFVESEIVMLNEDWQSK